MQTIPLPELSIVFIPAAFLIAIMYQWELKPWVGLYANARMLLQLLLVGYFLKYVFETTQPMVIIALIIVMIAVASWIAARPFEEHKPFLIAIISIGAPGLIQLGLVTQLVLDLPRWFEPNMVIPIAGMIFANSMNTVSLAAERFESEFKREKDPKSARRTALEAALIPQINSLFAVGLVALPGMMTGQILSGVDPIVAVRYQIMVMWMIFGSAGIAAAIYLLLRAKTLN